MKRSKQRLSHTRLASYRMGYLCPMACVEVLPGDTFRHSTSLLLRVAALLSPVMHQVDVRVHHWYVPNRIIWSGWEDFIMEGGGTVPTLVLNTMTKSGLANHLGVSAQAFSTPYAINALPIWGYNLIWNEYYRDSEIQSNRSLSAITMARVAWKKDYFTTARPSPQFGPAVVMDVRNPNALVSPIAANSLVGEISVAALRQAQWLQHFRENRSKFGTRYVDFLRSMGVTPSDARIGRPEYLGGGRSVIAFSEVLSTAATTDADVGDMAGHGIAAVRTRPYTRFFEEHGYVYTLVSVVPNNVYMSGLDRKFMRSLWTDWWNKESEILGDQQITNREVFAAATVPNGIFGFQGRHDDYRRELSTVAGDFEDIFDYWHFARKFTTDPALNAAFIECNPAQRPFAAQSNDTLYAMAAHEIAARRLVSKEAIR